ncbi:MAG TPA: DPP IV N-terminal domain-containing protein [Gemmatimonadaceae bacterium]|nr:DPP IV N-terminal domain-containing protein [Gemmatimonadaceae bacterium]
MRDYRWLRAAILLTVVLSIACSDASDPGPAAEYELLFVNTEKGVPGEDIFRMNADGTGRENLTRLSIVQYPTFALAVTYRSMALAPDGRTIAFESSRDGCPGIWGMSVDGSGIRKLSIGEYQSTRCNYYPLWAPDGARIAFTTSREGRWSVYVMDADGTNARNVSSPLDQESGFNWPAGWSPDGRIVFHHPTGSTGRFQAYTVKPDGTELRPLFGRTGDHSPDWSPDGSEVVFIRDSQTGSSLFIMKADGTNIRQLTTEPGEIVFSSENFQNDYNRWSPDGRRVAYIRRIESRNELHVINADGSGDVRLTSYSADFNGWAPDGRVTFSSDVNGLHDIYLINADGSGLLNLTNTSTSDEIRALWVRR